MTPIECWFSVEEIAAHFGVSKASGYRWLEQMGLRHGKSSKMTPTKKDHHQNG